MTKLSIQAMRDADAFSHTIVQQAPGLNRTAVRDALANFWTWRAAAHAELPEKSELVSYLAARIEAVGPSSAFTDFSFLQIAASHIWGGARTSHFALVQREARVETKPVRTDEWERAARAIENLPGDWKAPMLQHLLHSRDGGRSSKGVNRWSASHVRAVAYALARWSAFCEYREMDTLPTGGGFEAFGVALHEREDDPVAAAGVADYFSRIYTGFCSVVEPGFHSTACEFVMRDWRERGDREGTPTKTAAQLVSATVIYRLGFELMHQARGRRTRGMRAALDFRCGILLAIAVALPQRARALSVLELDRTLTILDDKSMHIHIPGRFIKQREHLKTGHPYDKVIRNGTLVAAITEYARDFRPIFDAGNLLFPSFHAPMQSISEHQIGQIAGDVTFRSLGVRVPIHRFRDNVATEISETMTNGGRLASAVLGHRDSSTTERHYDHSQSFQVASEYSEFVDLRRTAPTDLIV